MTTDKLSYEAPAVEKVGAFEALTQGGTTGSKFDGTFVRGQPVPLNPFGELIIFS